MALTELFLILINLFLQCSPLPLIIEIYQKKSVNPDRNPFIFIVLFINCIIQITYGILIWQSTIIISQILGISLSIIYLIVFYKYGNVRKKKTILKYIIFINVSMIIGLFCISKFDIKASIQIFGTLALLSSIVMMLSPLSTVKAVIRDRNSIHLPKHIVIATFVSCLAWLLYGIAVQDIFIWAPNVIGIPSSLFQIALLFKYPESKIINYHRISSPAFSSVSQAPFFEDGSNHAL